MSNHELAYITRSMTKPLAVPLACAGFGQFGGKLVDLLAGFRQRDGQPYYRTCAVNSYAGDLVGLRNIAAPTQYQLRGVEAGGGRMPELIRGALLDPATENQANLYELLDRTAGESPYLMMAAGLGGGTGTGLIWGLLDWLRQGLMPRPVGLILSLPRPEDGPRQHINAAKVLHAILRYMADQPQGGLSRLSWDDLRRRINSLILVDNGLLYREWKGAGEQGDWMPWGNQLVAERFHEMNMVASNSAGDLNFDAADFGKLLLYSGGCVTYARLKWDGQGDYERLAEDTRNAVTQGLFSTGYDLSTAGFWGGMFLRQSTRPANDARIRDAVESALRPLCPNRDDDKLGVGTWNHTASTLYVGVSGLQMPNRVGEILRTAREEEGRLRLADQARSAQTKALLDSAGPGLEAEAPNPFQRTSAPVANPFRSASVASQTPANPFLRR